MNKTTIYNGKMKIDLPDGFDKADEHTKQSNVSKFDYVFLSGDKKSIIAFIKNEKSLSQDEVELSLKKSYSVISRMTPGFQRGEAKLKRSDRFNIGILTYKSYAIDRDIFNVFAIMNLLNQELIMTFSCDMSESVFFLDKVIKSIESITITEEGNDNDDISKYTL